jgi:hypothetical protein
LTLAQCTLATTQKIASDAHLFIAAHYLPAHWPPNFWTNALFLCINFCCGFFWLFMVAFCQSADYSAAVRSPPEPLLMPLQNPASEWLNLTKAGLEALAQGDQREAAALWFRAATVARRSDISEPRQAAAQNNAGVSHLICSRGHEARRAFCRARRHWASARSSLRTEPPLAGAASSVFHLQLTMHHHDAFAGLQRRRSECHCRAGHGIVVLNACQAAGARPGKHDLDALAGDLADAFGPRCVEMAVLADYRAGAATRALPTPSPYQEKSRKVKRLHKEPASPGLAGEIELAARLTLLLHPALRCALTEREDGPSIEGRD